MSASIQHRCKNRSILMVDELEQRLVPTSSINPLVGASEDNGAWVRGAYERFLGRTAEPEGLNFWADHLAAGETPTAVIAGLLASPEYVGGRAATSTAWVDALYDDLLRRAADEPGREFWQDALAQGLSREAIVRSILDSTEFHTQNLEQKSSGGARFGLHLTPNDPAYLGNSLWGLNGAFGLRAPTAWDVTTGTTKVSVAILDTGVDYEHPDLYLNIWVNQAEIPSQWFAGADLLTTVNKTDVIDTDSDGLITFWDLNHASNASYFNDVNGDGRRSASDILAPLAEGGWADAVSNDGDAYIDDLVGWNFFDQNNRPQDDHGHGTHVSGTIGAVGNNGLGVVGVNWRVQLMPLRFIGRLPNGTYEGSDLDAADAVAYAAAHGARVSNNSYGGDDPSPEIAAAISAAAASGHLYVVSAGNDARDISLQPAYPAAYHLPNMLVVSATTSSGGLATYSNWSSTLVDLGAPGSGILSTVPGGYSTFSGTSMAAPHVAGTVALVLRDHPNWTNQQIVEQILANTTPMGSLAGKTVTGGLVNAHGAVRVGALPLVEDFADGIADHFRSRVGDWQVSGGRYNVTPPVGGDGLSTLVLGTSLPPGVEIQATMGATLVSGRKSNAALIFDYQSPTNFKFAHLAFGANGLALGHRDALGWQNDAFLPSAGITWGPDYSARLILNPNNTATLEVNGKTLSFTFGDSLTDGALGLGSLDSIARFDDLQFRAFTGGAALPYTEDFTDGVADNFSARSGTWSVASGRYTATGAVGADVLTTLTTRNPLPGGLEIFATLGASAITGTRKSNAAILFDYVNPTNFKYAILAFGAGALAIGHRDAAGWQNDTIITGTGIVAGNDYGVRLVLESSQRVTLEANGRSVSHTFADTLTDGVLGLGGLDSTPRFDDLQIRSFVGGAVLPYDENFTDGIADHFAPRAGTWSVGSGRYNATAPSSADAVSTLTLLNPLPSGVEFLATIGAGAWTPTRSSNAAIIFDYQNATDFKYIQLAFGANLVGIGRRTATGWQHDNTLTGAGIVSNVDYAVRVVLDPSGLVTVEVNGRTLSHTFADSLTDGGLGLGGYNSVARFDNVTIREFPPA